MSIEFDINKTRYTHRDYDSLKTDLINAIPSLTQEWTSREDADPGIVLIKLMSMFGDNLSFNVDKMALELYLDTVTQRKNCAKILRLLGYRMRWYRSAKVLAHVRLIDELASSAAGRNHVILKPFQTQFKSGDLTYTVVTQGVGSGDIDINSSTVPQVVRLVEGRSVTVNFYSRDLVNNRYYFNQKNVDDTQFWMTYGPSKRPCVLIDNLYLATDDQNVSFEFGVDEYDNPYIELINYWQDIVGANSDSSSSFELRYILSSGSKGNVTSDAFTSVLGISQGKSSNLVITNLSNNDIDIDPNSPSMSYNSKGYDPQTVEDAKKDSANYVFTHDTLVTSADFERACKRVDGMTGSKLVDNEIIYNENLDINDIISRALDKEVFFDQTQEVTDDGGAVWVSFISKSSTVTKESVINLEASASLNDYSKFEVELDVGSHSPGVLVTLQFNKSDGTLYSTQSWFTKGSRSKVVSSDELKSTSGITISSIKIINDTDSDPITVEGIYGCKKDSSGSSVTETMLKAYTVIMYLIYQDFDMATNYYLGPASTDADYRYRSFSNWDNINEKIKELHYFPYKISKSLQNLVSDVLHECQIMNVKVMFGTAKVYPFKIGGTLYLTEPLNPLETFAIYENIDTNLEQFYYPDTHSFGDKPSFIDIVDTITNTDPRIKYFDAYSTIIEYPDFCIDDKGQLIGFDTTSFVKYCGLSNNFTFDSRFLKYTISNLIVPHDEEDIGSAEDGTDPNYLSIKVTKTDEEGKVTTTVKKILDDKGNIYKIAPGNSATIQLKSIDELETLCTIIRTRSNISYKI